MCSQEEVSWRTQSPYQVWLARKVEGAVEKALHYEGQQILEEFAAPRKWDLPQICEERHLVTTKIRSLLLQWRPDFSAQWSLKLRRALPILEILFAHLASSKEDFSNPLLIEPRLKGVLSLLDSNCHNRSPLWSIQSSTHHRLANYLYCFHHPCHHICSAGQIEAEDKACASKFCLRSGEERSHQNGQESPFYRSYLDADKEGQDDKGHEVYDLPNLGEPSDKTYKAISAISESCLYWEEKFDTKAPNALVFGSCLGITDEHDEVILDDSLEWSTVNLPSRGTVASLMASELRSSRKEEANQALWNALASEEVALLKDNLHKHGEFASKWMVRKIMTMLKRSKKTEKHQKAKKLCAGQLLNDAAGEGIRCAESPTLSMRKSLSRGFFGLFSCHTIASQERSLPADQKPLPTDLETLEMNHPSSVVCTHLQHVGHHTKEDDVIHLEMPISCSSSIISSTAASVELSSADVDSNEGNDSGSSHNIHCANDPINETSASLVTHLTGTNGSEELICSKSKDSDDKHSRMPSENVSMCKYNGEAGITVRALSPGYGCVDVQVDLGQLNLYDSNDVISSNQVAHSEQGSGTIISADERVGHTDENNPKGAYMVSCSDHGDSESFGSSSVFSHDNDDDKDGIRPSARRSITNDPVEVQKEEGACFIEAYTGVKGRREDSPNCSLSLGDLACGGPCKTSMDSGVDWSGNTKKHRNTNKTFSHRNSNDQKLAEDTSSLQKDGESQEEGAGTSRYLPQDTEKDTQVAEDPTELGSMRQSRDGGSSSGSRRGRIPLSSLLAETEDWNVLSTRSFRAWGSSCPWDTWEEPNEALDPLCCVCMMGLKGAAFTPCGHTFCRKCSRELWQGRGTCPLCNKHITGILDIF